MRKSVCTLRRRHLSRLVDVRLDPVDSGIEVWLQFPQAFEQTRPNEATMSLEPLVGLRYLQIGCSAGRGRRNQDRRRTVVQIGEEASWSFAVFIRLYALVSSKIVS